MTFARYYLKKWFVLWSYSSHGFVLSGVYPGNSMSSEKHCNLDVIEGGEGKAIYNFSFLSFFFFLFFLSFLWLLLLITNDCEDANAPCSTLYCDNKHAVLEVNIPPESVFKILLVSRTNVVKSRLEEAASCRSMFGWEDQHFQGGWGFYGTPSQLP